MVVVAVVVVVVVVVVVEVVVVLVVNVVLVFSPNVVRLSSSVTRLVISTGVPPSVFVTLSFLGVIWDDSVVSATAEFNIMTVTIKP